MQARELNEKDRENVLAFLNQHMERSLFLLNNIERSGLNAGDKPYTGQYWGAFEGDTLVGVVALYWNGMIIPYAPTPEGLRVLADALRSEANREVQGLVGDRGQVDWLAGYLGYKEYQMDSPETLFTLELDNLIEPVQLSDPALECRLSREEDLNILVPWREAYNIEAMSAVPGEANYRKARGMIETDIKNGVGYVLTLSGRPVAMSCFNALVGSKAQVGGVYTPPELRGRGYARAVVAGSLVDARNDGARRAILFTGLDNVAARQAYLALGFHPIGEFSLKLLR